jgi:hypothetical protein
MKTEQNVYTVVDLLNRAIRTTHRVHARASESLTRLSRMSDGAYVPHCIVPCNAKAAQEMLDTERLSLTTAPGN